MHDKPHDEPQNRSAYYDQPTDDWDGGFWSISGSVEETAEELTEEEHFRMTCEVMLEYLERSYLEVAINHENCTRIVINQNTQWYQDFCACYQNYSWIYQNTKRTKRKKRYRTIIKRCHTIAALKRMANGDLRGEYATRLMEFVENFWVQYAKGY